MEQKESSNTVKIILNVIGILAFATLAYFLIRSDKSGTPLYQDKEINTTEEVSKTVVGSDQLPENLPTDLPFIKEGRVSENFNNSSSETTQAVRKWEVAKSPSEVLKAYEDYFKNNGWNITTSFADGDINLRGATKGNLSISVTVTKITNNTSTVEVSTNKSK